MKIANIPDLKIKTGSCRSGALHGFRLVLLLPLLLAVACADEPGSALPQSAETAAMNERPADAGPSAPLPRPKPERPSRPKKAAPKPAPEAPVAEAPAAPRPEPWKIEKLVGMTEAQAREQLGEPSFQEDAAPARIWLYTAESCSVRVYFFPEVQSLVYRVLRYEVLGTDDTERCVAELRKGGGSAAQTAATGYRTA